jgi:hypothetical protein
MPFGSPRRPNRSTRERRSGRVAIEKMQRVDIATAAGRELV